MTTEEKSKWYEGYSRDELALALMYSEKENKRLKKQLSDLKKYMKDNNLGAYGDDLK